MTEFKPLLKRVYMYMDFKLSLMVYFLCNNKKFQDFGLNKQG